MRAFKNTVISILAIGAIVFSGYFIYQKSLSQCGRTIHYSIGKFDTQFGITSEEFKNYLVQSETVWEDALGRNVFVYDPSADFKINLIYDERQLETFKKQKTEFGLSAAENAFKELDEKFDLYKSQYDQRAAAYEKTVLNFNEEKSEYEKIVSEWNAKGGATKEAFDSLEAERRSLNTEAEKLNKEAYVINSMSKQLNALLSERNEKAAEYNKIAENYNQKYGGSLEFNQAEYEKSSDGEEDINVYQFGSKKDLIFALSHEFGHALGLDHVENQSSLMYYISGSNVGNFPVLTIEDLAELKKICKVE